MQNYYFHNDKFIKENPVIKRPTLLNKTNKKRSVDINRLLNRVKLDHKNEKKQKFVLLSLSIFLICSMGVFVTIIK